MALGLLRLRPDGRAPRGSRPARPRGPGGNHPVSAGGKRAGGGAGRGGARRPLLSGALETAPPRPACPPRAGGAGPLSCWWQWWAEGRACLSVEVGLAGRGGVGAGAEASCLRTRPPSRFAGRDSARTSTCIDPRTVPPSAAAMGYDVGLWGEGDLKAWLRTSPGGQRAEASPRGHGRGPVQAEARTRWCRRTCQLGCSLLMCGKCAWLPVTCL